ncbi:MAG: transcriptional repressor LexA [Actinomycetaceae bacterium]|nr:transcriptional repressor LexA [Actinomycetaceae bacterium]
MTDEESTVRPLSKRQIEVLDALQSLATDLGYPPSVRELAGALSLSSPSSVKHHLDVLETKGYLRRTPNSPRALEIVNLPQGASRTQSPPSIETYPLPIGISDTEQSTQVPLVGQIAAGMPITADQLVEDTFCIPQFFTGTGELFMLKVVGDSMNDAAICSGDWVVVRHQATALPGEIVAALLDNEATVKVFAKRDGHIWLDPCNPDYQPILGDAATILGKVVTVIRSL